MLSQTRDQPLRVCFYLPVVTPWWFENIVVPLIRTLAHEHDVHVVVPPMWKGTGMDANQAHLVKKLGHVHWHILNGPDHPILRYDASDNDELIEFLHLLSPDLTLCRSADIKTPAQFPGHVRYIMEGGAPPFWTGQHWIVLSSGLFDHGLLPDLSAEQEVALDNLADLLFSQALDTPPMPSRSAVFEAAGLCPETRTVAVPLEYEHEENFFRQHLTHPDNARFLYEVARSLPDDTQMLVTDHPLNALYCDMSAVEEALAGLSGKAGLLRSESVNVTPTLAAAHHCDAMVVDNSKCWSLCAAFAKPVLRLSNFASADWLCAYRDWPSFLEDISREALRGPDTRLARRWFAFRIANDLFDPKDPQLTATGIIERAFTPVSPSRWDAGIRRVSPPQRRVA